MADLAEGARFLAAADPVLAAATRDLPPPPLRISAEGYGSLLRILVSQQLSVAAANSIWERLGNKGLHTAEAVVRARPASLTSAGLSRPKTRYAKDIAKAVTRGDLDLKSLRRMSDDEAIEALCKHRGIGQWTAELYLMFSLGRPDIMPAGDLALREGARTALGLKERPDEAALRQRAEMWSPWRSVAARMLWQHYRQRLGREGVVAGG